MALQKRHTIIVFGKELAFDEAYQKILKVTGNKNRLEINLAVYDDSLQKYLIESRVFYFSPSVDEGSSNFIKQGYEYLKTLEEYKDAIDVLED